MSVVYVASKTDNYERVRVVQQMCIRYGHTVAHDWTANLGEGGTAALPGRGVSREMRRHFAEVDRQGVREADLLILLCYPGLCGTLIEFGMAAEREIDIWVVGQPERDSVFFELHHVTRVDPEDLESEVAVYGYMPD